MTSREKLPKKSLTRSVRLKKYEAVYKRLICKVTKPKVTKPKVKITKSRSKLTDYQKYVRIESKRLKYKKLVPSARLGAIGAAWMEDRCK